MIRLLFFYEQAWAMIDEAFLLEEQASTILLPGIQAIVAALLEEQAYTMLGQAYTMLGQREAVLDEEQVYSPIGEAFSVH